MPKAITFKQRLIKEVKEQYSGKLILRIDSDVHKKLAIKAMDKGVSLNLLLNIIIEEWLRNE